MTFNQSTTQRIIAALKERGVPKACALCGTNKWTLGEGYYYLVGQKEFPGLNISGSGMPLAAMVCLHCGNTHLINLIQLGLHDLFPETES